MKRHYFLVCALFGILCEWALTSMILHKAAWQILREPPLGIVIGVIATILAGHAADRYFDVSKKRFLKTLFAAEAIFLTGVLVGVMADFIFLFKELFTGPRPLYERPLNHLFFLGYFGIPAALLVGFIYYLIGRFVFRIRD